MIQVYKDTIPRYVKLACSGGIDSMAALSFLRRIRRTVTVLHFNHGTPHGEEAARFVFNYCSENHITVVLGRASCGLNSEGDFREERINFFAEHGGSSVITAHHLDDAAEWWLMTSFKGAPKLMPMYGVTHKPFLLNEKEKLREWARKNKTPFIQDPTNKDPKHTARNKVRHAILPEVLSINPGFKRTIRKQYLK